MGKMVRRKNKSKGKRKKKHKTQILNDKREKKSPQPESQSEEPTAAQLALRKHLKSKLRTRCKMLQTSRQGGSSQEMQQIMKNFNDGDEEKAELMREIQNDVRGMPQRKAKQYLRQVLNTMDTEHADNFVDIVKDKMSGHQSGQIVNYVKRHKKLKKQHDTNKPHVNPETVYTPVRLMTPEQKAEVKRLRKQSQSIDAISLKKKKKKKMFGKVNIHVPKITEMRNHATGSDLGSNTVTPAPALQKRKKKKGFNGTRKSTPDLEDINRLFSPHTTQTKEMEALSYSARNNQIQNFNGDHTITEMKQFLLESANAVELVKVKELTWKFTKGTLPVPDIEEKIIPVKNNWSPPKSKQDSEWVYSQNSEGKWVKQRNAHLDYLHFLKRLEAVRSWLKTLTNTMVPWQWICQKLHTLGIIRKKIEQPQSSKDRIWTEKFHLLCMEYQDDRTGRTSVPLVPFVNITVSC